MELVQAITFGLAAVAVFMAGRQSRRAVPRKFQIHNHTMMQLEFMMDDDHVLHIREVQP
jgi:hypothetical protein